MEDKVAKGEARKFAFDRGASGLCGGNVMLGCYLGRSGECTSRRSTTWNKMRQIY